MRVIVISGKAGNGKDTIASMMKEKFEKAGKRVLITHYGDLVKYICTKFFAWDGKKDEKGRTLLQRVGTDVVRKQDNDFWVNFVQKVLSFFPDEWDYVLIPDARFPNEIKGYKDCVHVRIIRPNFIGLLTKEQEQHISETALDNISADIVVYNDSTLEMLNRISEFVAFSIMMDTYHSYDDVAYIKIDTNYEPKTAIEYLCNKEIITESSRFDALEMLSIATVKGEAVRFLKLDLPSWPRKYFYRLVYLKSRGEFLYPVEFVARDTVQHPLKYTASEIEKNE